jgi:two-component system sensor histidine kinase DesK
MDWRQRLRNAFTEDSPWPWLAYLALFFFPWFFRAPQTDELIVAAIALPLFLVLYFRGYSACDWRAIAYAAAIATIGFGAIPIMPSAGVFLVYAGSMVGGVRPARLAIAWLVLLVLAIAAYGLILDLPLFAWGPVAFFTGMIGFANYMWAEMRKKNEALQAANAKVQQLATQAERERIARDMHDLLGHTLTVIAVKAELAGKLVGSDPARAQGEIEDIQATARHALQEVRYAINDMKRASLAAEIASARAALAAADVKLESQPHLPVVPAPLEPPIALLIRESVTNVVRHAQASVCRISLDRTDDHIRLEISDDGRGGVNEAGNGVSGMRARVAALGGEFSLRSEQGTVVEAVLPLGAGAEA